MATVPMEQPTHYFHRAPWVILAAVIVLPILTTLGVMFLGPGK